MTNNSTLTNITNEQKALSLLSKLNTTNSNLVSFEKKIGVHVGVEPKEYFPKLKDANGKAIIQKNKYGKDEAVRSEVSKGWQYTFSELGTAKTIIFVSDKKIEDLSVLGLYVLKGEGYEIKNKEIIQSYFIFENTACKKL